MFWLSHHHEEEYNRTYLLGGVRVCARCLGTYPVLLAVMMSLQFLAQPFVWRNWPVDEVMLGLVPTRLGQGTPFFKDSDAQQRFELLEARPLSNGTVILRYAPRAA